MSFPLNPLNNNNISIKTTHIPIMIIPFLVFIMFFVTCPVFAIPSEISVENQEEKSIIKENTDSKPIKNEVHLAIVMGGAVSLGAFEAGILAELVKQLEIYNREDNPNRYVIDVLVGASAGSMSLALLAKEMYSSQQDSSEDYNADSSIFYKAWVKDIDIKKLLPKNRKNLIDDPYIFSSEEIENIGSKYLCAPMNGQPKNFAPDTLYMGMTISHMQGSGYNIQYQNGHQPVYLHSEKRFFELSDCGKDIALLEGNLDGKTIDYAPVNWKIIKETALASGAFPFAFKPIRLNRISKEYEITPFNIFDCCDFYYVDGGFFNNDPVNMAQQLAKTRDKQIQSKNPDLKMERKFIFLAPEVDSSQSIMKPETVTNLVEYGKHIFKMGLNTASSQDYQAYLKQERENNHRINSLVEYIYSFKDTINYKQSFSRLARIAEYLAEKNFENIDLHLIKTSAEVVDEKNILVHTNTRYDHKLDQTEKDELVKYVKERIDWTNTGYTREEKKQNLVEEKHWLADSSTNSLYREFFRDMFERMNLHKPNDFILISNDSQFKTAGSKYSSFGGFFSEEIRKYDFNLGRYYAQRSLTEQLKFDLGVSKLDSMDMVKFKKTLKKSHNELRTFKDHFTEDSTRQWFRHRLDERLLAYAYHLKLDPLLVYYGIDANLNKSVFYYSSPLFYKFEKLTNQGKTFRHNFKLFPARFSQKESKYGSLSEYKYLVKDRVKTKNKKFRRYYADYFFNTAFGINLPKNIFDDPFGNYTYSEIDFGIEHLFNFYYFKLRNFRFDTMAGCRIYDHSKGSKARGVLSLGTKLSLISFNVMKTYEFDKNFDMYWYNGIEWNLGLSINISFLYRYNRAKRNIFKNN